MIERKAYQCEHCRTPKIMVTKRRMAEHEKNCIFNIENKTCATCDYNEYYSKENNCMHPNTERKGPETFVVVKCPLWEPCGTNCREEE